MKVSKLHFYSLGYVTKDIEEDDVWLDIHPVELLPNADGVIDDIEEERITTVDIHGEVFKTKINKSFKITAKWLNGDNVNRLTAPNICKGETVRIYRYGNTDKYFWRTLYNELDLRKLEKATYVYSNKRTIQDKTLLDKVYYWTIDTINKFIRLHTDDSDGELTTYDLEINTLEGKVTLIDGKDNSIILDSDLENLNITINNDKIDVIGNDKHVKVGNNVTENIKNRKDITLSKLSITNQTAELIATLSELVQANIDEQHVGNLGINTGLNSASVDKYKSIKEKIDSFI